MRKRQGRISVSRFRGDQVKQKLLGVNYDNVTMAEALDIGSELLKTAEPDYVVTPNSEILYQAQTDDVLLCALNGASLILPDGIGVVKASRILKSPLKEKVAGIEFGEAMIEYCAQNGYSVFFLGSKPGIAEAAAARMEEKYPGLRIAGTHDGYFSDNDEIVSLIKAAEPDMLFVCLGAPKQELWMHEYAAATGAKLVCGLGGSLDIFAGVSQRAPDIWIRLGLEWAYRLFKEPWRIKRQKNLPRFLVYVIKKRILGEYD